MCDGHKSDDSERHVIGPERFSNLKRTSLPW